MDGTRTKDRMNHSDQSVVSVDDGVHLSRFSTRISYHWNQGTNDRCNGSHMFDPPSPLKILPLLAGSINKRDQVPRRMQPPHRS